MPPPHFIVYSIVSPTVTVEKPRDQRCSVVQLSQNDIRRRASTVVCSAYFIGCNVDRHRPNIRDRIPILLEVTGRRRTTVATGREGVVATDPGGVAATGLYNP